MRQPHAWVARWSATIIEIGWLAAIFCVPSFFNLLSSRHFEPDKALLFRFIVVFLSTFVVINQVSTRLSSPDTGSPATWWHRYRTYPLMIAILSYGGVFILSTITSIVPDVSFWGSYQRLQGTYTNISYVVLALIIVQYATTAAQQWRIVGMLILASLIPTAYGYVQFLEMDPLPWKGDVITRVASTHGNSIFIAAYLILIVPFVLANGIRHLRIARSIPDQHGPTSWWWSIGHAANVVALLTIMFGGMQLSAVVRSIDTLHWWMYPGAILGGFSIALLLTQSLPQQPRFNSLWIVPAVLITLYATISQFVGLSSHAQLVQPDPTHFGANWSWWLWGATLSAWVGVAAYVQAPYATQPSRRLHISIAVASFVVALANWVTIILSQSRGPWIGGASGLFLFCVLGAIYFMRTHPTHAATAKRMLLTTVFLFIILFGFLVIFNFTDSTLLRPLRDVPYIGRMGRLFDVGPGTTGDVRMKIWFGDQYGSGAVGLIMSDPLRTIIGWGPESMFAAYTPFYPPSLANIESRSATPDRSHQAFLDELVTKGLIGLVSYLAVIFLAFRAAWRQLTHAAPIEQHVLVIALIAVLVSHLVEGLTGIPIVTSLMVQWIAIALIIIGDRTIASLPPQPAITPVATATTSTKPTKTVHPRGAASVSTTNTSHLPFYLGYVSILTVGFLIAWSTNINNMYADMRFQQAQTYNTSAIATNNSDQQIIALHHYLTAATLMPNQDYYYLNIGRSLLTLAEARRRQNNSVSSTHQVDFYGLSLQSDPSALKQFLAPLSARDITLYAEEALLRANQLYPRNKDHSANLARLYLFWFNRIEQDPTLLDSALFWFDQSATIAPNDVSIINDYAGALINYATVLRDSDRTRADELLVRAETLLTTSQQRDARYRDTVVRLGDLARAKGDYTVALGYYKQALTQNHRALDSQISTIINQLAKQPDAHPFLRELRQIYIDVRPPDNTTILSIIGLLSSRINDSQEAIAAFGLLTELQPDNLEAQQNYTLVLSNALQYDDAYRASERLYQLAEDAGYPPSSLAVYAQLRDYFATKLKP